MHKTIILTLTHNPNPNDTKACWSHMGLEPLTQNEYVPITRSAHSATMHTATIQRCSRWLRASVFSTSHAIRHCVHGPGVT